MKKIKHIISCMIILVAFVTNECSGQILAWQFGVPASLGSEATYNATTNNVNLNTSALSRGSGMSAAALARGFSSNNWDAIIKTDAIANNEYYQFTVNAKAGYAVSLSTLDATIRRSSATAPNAYIWKYSLDGTTFTEIGTDVSYTGITEGVSQPQINLSGISALQKVANTTTITFRIYAWGSSSLTSTFAFGRYAAGLTTNSLAIGGTIVRVPTITSFSPTTGIIGNTVTINGTGFSTTPANNIVYFGAVKASVSASTATSLTVTVPAGAGSIVPISVEVGGLVAYSTTGTTPFFNLTNTPNLVLNYTQSTLGVGNGPYSIAIGDFNGDGNADLATANSNTQNVSVLLGNGVGGFGAKTDFAVGTNPCSVAIGDFNGDGNVDMATVNSASANVSVLIGNGAGSFGTATNFAVGAGPLSIAIADFNGDGNADIATADNGWSNISVLLGNGAGGFGMATELVVSADPCSVAIGDFNGDGKADIVATSWSTDNVSVLLGNGAGSFGAATNFAVDAHPESIAIGDFNGDGKTDIATANSTFNTVSILLGNGAGSFGAPTNFPVGSNPRSMAIGDFNGDGKIDLATANYNTNNVSVILGNGAGGFGAVTNFVIGSNPYSIAIGDFNGDGKADMAAANYTSNNVSVLLNTIPPTITSATYNAATGDLVVTGTDFLALAGANNDIDVSKLTLTGEGGATYTLTTADVEITSATQFTITLNPANIAGLVPILNKNGIISTGGTTYNLAASEDWAAGAAAAAVVADLAGNGITVSNVAVPSISSATYDASIGALIVTGTGFLKLSGVTNDIDVSKLTLTGQGGATYTLTTADVEITSATQFTITLNATDYTGLVTILNKNGTSSISGTTYNLAAAEDWAAGADTNVVVADLAGNGITVINIAALTITSFSPTTGTIGNTVTITGTGFSLIPANNIVFWGAAKANVSAATANSITVTVPAGAGSILPVSVEVGGLIAYSIICTTPFFNLTNTPNLVLNYTLSTLGAGSSPQSIAIGDFNGDGKADLATANNVSNNVSVSLGDGAGGFGAKTDFAAGSGPCSVAIGDLNGDGYIDIAAANLYSANVSVLLGNGAGSFGAATNFAVGDSPYSVVIGDFNGDGKADIATAGNSTNTVSVLLGNGAGGFGAATHFALGTGASSIAIGDFNGDGKADLAIANNFVDMVSVLIGNGGGGFGAATTFAVGDGPRSIAIGDYNGDGKADIAAANANSNNVSILIGNGAGSFGAATSFATGTGTRSVAMGDFNGDGKADLATANNSANNVSVLLGNGLGGFGATTNFAVGTNPYSIAIGDFNGDGKADLATANNTSNNVSVLLYTTPPGIPDAPVATAATGMNAAGFIANWNVSASATGYRLDVATNIGFTAFVSGYNDLDVTNVTNYSVPVPTCGNTYYYRIRAYNGFGTSGSSNTITVTNSIPSISGTTPGSHCDAGTVSLGATASAGIINWYADLTGGASLVPGPSYTPSISFTTTYYVDATNAGCTTAVRTAVVATINYSTTSSTSHAACGSYVWNGTTYTTSGDKTFVTTNAHGCDSTATLHLTINNSSIATQTVTACESYTWYGTTYYASGTDTHVIPNAAGCDSTITLNLTINSSLYSTLYDFNNTSDLTTYFNPDSTLIFTNVSTGGLNNTGSVSIPSSGSDVWTLKNGYSMNNFTTYTLSAYFKNSSNSGLGGLGFAAANQNEPGANPASIPSISMGMGFHGGGGAFINNNTVSSVSWPPDLVIGNWYKMIYKLTPKGGNAFDVVFEIWNSDANGTLGALKTTQTALNVINANIGGASLIYPCFSNTGNRMSAMDNFEITRPLSITGITQASRCDAGSVTLGATANSGMINWYNAPTGGTPLDTGTIFTTPSISSTTPYYVEATNAGCATIGRTAVVATINNSTTSSTSHTTCDSYLWNGTTYNTSGDKTFVTTNAQGCDSTATLHLTINNSTTSSTSQTACDNYLWNGTTYNTSGDKTFVTTNALGCDSTATLHLTINNSTTSSTSQTACDNYLWNGTTYTTSGDKTFVTTNALGCDSTATLHLTINNSTTSSTSQTACDNYLWNGTTYTTSGDKTFVTTNTRGCDSTATLHLTINYSTASSSSHTTCDSYLWNGTTYNTSGDKTFVTTNALGCDSTATLHLTINNSTTSSTSQTACDNYLWNGTTYNTSGDKTFVTTNAQGCDSTATLHLTINSSTTSTQNISTCDSYTAPDGAVYTSSGIETAVISTVAGCDSTITINLTINTVDVSLTITDLTLTANTIADTYQWIDCDNAYAPIGGSILQSYTATSNGNYAVIITQGLCSDTSACVQIMTVGIFSENLPRIALYPNPSDGHFTLELEESAKIEIFNALGSLIFDASFEKGTHSLSLNLADGVYLIKATNDKVSRSLRVMIQK